MKTIKMVLIGFMALLPVISSANINNDLKYGSKGQEVTELQEFLIDKGFLKTTATGNFYSLTKSAVMSYQSSENLPSTGFVGPMTREKINAVLSVDTSAEVQETGTVTPPSDTTAVSSMQKQLDDLKTLLATLITKQQAQVDAQVTQAAQTQQQIQVLGAIAQNTTPAPVVAPVVAPTPVPASIKIVIDSMSEPDPDHFNNSFPHGQIAFKAIVLDQFGKSMKNQTVKMTNPSDNLFVLANPNVDEFEQQTTSHTSHGLLTTEWLTGGVSYIPSTGGTKTITFTSGNLSTTTTIEVK